MVIVAPDTRTLQVGDRAVEKHHRDTTADKSVVKFEVGPVVARTDKDTVDTIAVENLEIRTLGQEIFIRKRQDDPVTVRLQNTLHGGGELQIE